MKQYTVEELRAEFEKGFILAYDRRRDQHGDYVVHQTYIEWRGWLECARFLGAIKERQQ